MPDDIKTTLHLVQRAKSGESAALNLLLDHYMERVLRIVRMRLGKHLRSKLESMDVVQEVMIRALRGFDNFEAKDEKAFVHWLGKLVQNQIRDLADYHGAGKRDHKLEVASLHNSDKERSVLSKIPAEGIIRPSIQIQLKQEILELEAALDQLNDTQREVVIMRQEEMSFSEIGKELNLSEDAARMQFARAMNKLTDLMS